jgi:endonuclease/exonuclease/phosphatase family metal-dependent hydrolase
MVPADVRKVVGSSFALSCLLIAACAPVRAPVPGETSRQSSLRVMTYNIQAGGGKLENVAQTIRSFSPDIVGLQEVDVHWSARSAFADQATMLAEMLGMQQRFARIYQIPAGDSTRPPREYGVAILSKCPIVSFTNHMLTRLSTQDSTAPPAPMPGFLESAVDFRGTRIRLFNTHIDYRRDPSIRRQQVSEMLAIIGQPRVPTLLFGDMNAPPEAPELQPLFARLRDVWLGQADAGATYPATAPVRRIDYVLTSSHFVARSASVPVTVASDHRPVVADLVLTDTPSAWSGCD